MIVWCNNICLFGNLQDLITFIFKSKYYKNISPSDTKSKNCLTIEENSLYCQVVQNVSNAIPINHQCTIDAASYMQY